MERLNVLGRLNVIARLDVLLTMFGRVQMFGLVRVYTDAFDMLKRSVRPFWSGLFTNGHESLIRKIQRSSISAQFQAKSITPILYYLAGLDDRKHVIPVPCSLSV